MLTRNPRGLVVLSLCGLSYVCDQCENVKVIVDVPFTVPSLRSH